MKTLPQIKITKSRDKDPSLSRPLYNRWIKGIDKQYNSLKEAITEYAVTENRLGAVEATTSRDIDITALVEPKKKYIYSDSAARVEDFTRWLDQQVADGILASSRTVEGIVGYGNQLWSDVFIYSAYQQGIQQARTDLKNSGIELPDLGPAAVAFNRPFHANRVALLYTRSFNGMRGVTEAMKSQMAAVLATGIAEGRSPYDIAYKLRDRVDKIGITRSRLIARTETVRAHNEGSLNEYEALEGIVGEPIMVQWWTALDERVRATHQERHGRVYTLERARELVGEPNCRCALLPWTKFIEDSKKK